MLRRFSEEEKYSLEISAKNFLESIQDDEQTF